ncbi:MAG: hypothetical protein KDA75_13685 [Planctomycetaceae bacterium]|nr:hypothetical protein [Planctomycetaceae bacterium]
MQVQLQAFSRKTESLRQVIVNDLADKGHDVLYVQEFKNVERKPGWAKIRGTGMPGAINIKWDASSHMLTARVVTRGGNKPYQLLGVFLEYVTERHGRKISSINIQLR